MRSGWGCGGRSGQGWWPPLWVSLRSQPQAGQHGSPLHPPQPPGTCVSSSGCLVCPGRVCAKLTCLWQRPRDCLHRVLGGCVRACVCVWERDCFGVMGVGVILEGCLRGSGVSAEGVRVSSGPVGCVRAIRGLCLCLNGQGAPATGPSGPGLLPTVPTPSSHHAAAESLISLVGETGAVPEMCGREGSGWGWGVVSTGQGPRPPFLLGRQGLDSRKRPAPSPAPTHPGGSVPGWEGEA